MQTLITGRVFFLNKPRMATHLVLPSRTCASPGAESAHAFRTSQGMKGFSKMERDTWTPSTGKMLLCLHHLGVKLSMSLQYTALLSSAPKEAARFRHSCSTSGEMTRRVWKLLLDFVSLYGAKSCLVLTFPPIREHVIGLHVSSALRVVLGGKPALLSLHASLD